MIGKLVYLIAKSRKTLALIKKRGTAAKILAFNGSQVFLSDINEPVKWTAWLELSEVDLYLSGKSVSKELLGRSECRDLSPLKTKKA